MAFPETNSSRHYIKPFLGIKECCCVSVCCYSLAQLEATEHSTRSGPQRLEYIIERHQSGKINSKTGFFGGVNTCFVFSPSSYMRNFYQENQKDKLRDGMFVKSF